MGVANSKRVYSDEPDEPEKKGAKEGEEPAAGEPGAEEKPEAPPEDMGPIDKTEAIKWKPFFKDILKMPEAKDKIKTLILDDKAAKGSDEYGKKGIIIKADDVTDFAYGDKEFIMELLLYLKEGLPGKKGEPPIKLDQAKAEALTTGPQADNNGKQIRNLKPNTPFKSVDADILVPLISAAKLALKHKMFLRVLKKYILDTDTFKEEHKRQDINENKEDIKSGKKTVADALEENKTKDTAKDKPPEPEKKEGDDDKKEGADDKKEGADDKKEGADDKKEGGNNSDSASFSTDVTSLNSYGSVGGDDNISYTSSVGGDDSSTASTTIPSSGSDISSISGLSGISGISDISGGYGDNNEQDGGLNRYSFVPDKLITDKKLRELKGKKDYKKFKKQTRADFDEKTKTFFNDTSTVDTFMENNEKDILALMYYKRGVPFKWIDKSKKEEKRRVATALVKAIIEYKPSEPGAEGAPPEPGAEGAPLVEGAKSLEGESSTDPTPPSNPVAPGIPNALPGIKLPGAGADATTEGGAIMQGGGGSSNQKKQKKFTRKKNQRINISINVGNKNVISDTSSSSSSSSSSSDEDDETIRINKKKYRKKSK